MEEPTTNVSATPSAASGRSTTPAGLIAVAWLFVGIPAAWGVSQTVIKSLDLFRSTNAPAAPAAVQSK